MNLISLDWFDGDANLPGRDKTGSDEGLQRYINEYEPDFMRRALGVAFYDVFKTAIASSRMQDLKNGKIYQVDGKSKYWQGLAYEKTEDGKTTRLSPIVDYVFYKWNDGKVTRPSNTGRIIPNVDNAKQDSPVQIMVKVWNKMVDTIRSMHCFLNENTTIYPEWDKKDTDVYLLVKINELGI